MIYHGDSLQVLKTLESNSVNCCVTSPPYWGLRDYGVNGQIGLETSIDEYVSKLVDVFREVKRVLKNDGTLWLNMGDSYSGSGKGLGGPVNSVKQQSNKGSIQKGHNFETGNLKPKDLCGIPWRVAFALQKDGWYLRQDIIWHKPNPMPESVTDRCTKAHEYIFLLSKSKEYYFDSSAMKEPAAYGAPNSPNKIKSPYGQGFTRKAKGGGKKYSENSVCPNRDDTQNLDKAGLKIYDTRNKRSVWTVSTKPYKGAHFATFPTGLITPCVLAGCPERGMVLDPFFGAGTTGLVAISNNRDFIGIELNQEYIEIAEKRLTEIQTKMRLCL
jgi:DNA modification methylase